MPLTLSRQEKPLTSPKARETPSSEVAELKEILRSYGYNVDADVARRKEEAARISREKEAEAARQMLVDAEVAKTRDMAKLLISSHRVLATVNEQPVDSAEFSCPSCGRIYAGPTSALNQFAESFWRSGLDPKKSYLEQTNYSRSLPYFAIAETCPCGSESKRFRMWVMP